VPKRTCYPNEPVHLSLGYAPQIEWMPISQEELDSRSLYRPRHYSTIHQLDESYRGKEVDLICIVLSK
jgi:hypothetical protein